MITFTDGSIIEAFKEDKDRVANETSVIFYCVPVNCVGVPGAGLAKAFADADPRWIKDYKQLCLWSVLTLNCIACVNLNEEPQGTKILLIPTKNHWKENSEEKQVLNVLAKIQGTVEASGAKDICVHIPALGCGLGGLQWESLKPKLASVLEKAPHIHWIVYEPKTR